MSDVTHILCAIEQGDPHAAEKLLPLVYDELRKLAAARFAEEKAGQTLQPTALVHEAYLRLVGGQHEQNWSSRGHFFAAAAEAMRRILVENARRKRRIRHGGEWKRATADLDQFSSTMPPEELLALDEALEKLADEDPLKAKLIKMRFFLGMTNEEAAEALRISTATAKRSWRFARAWLLRELNGESNPAQLDGTK